MSKRDKLIAKILKRGNNVSPSEACKLLEFFGYLACGPSGGSSHLTFRKENSLSVTIVLTQNPLKSYMLDKLVEVIKKEGFNE